MTDLPPIVSPFDFSEARVAIDGAGREQRDAEQARVDATKDFAEKEKTYRIALAKEIVRQKGNGAAWTVAPDLARGDERVAQFRYERDVAEGVKDAAEQAAWRLNGDRRDLSKLIEWSMKVAPLGQQVESPSDNGFWGGLAG